MKNILLYGDSNTWGFNPDFTSKSDLRFAREERWGGVLQECLGPECCVLEEGLSGRTTSLEDPAAPGRSGLALLAPIVQSHQPLDLLVFLLGTNDMKNTYHASVADIRRGMELVLQAALCPYAWDTRKPPKMLLQRKNRFTWRPIMNSCRRTMAAPSWMRHRWPLPASGRVYTWIKRAIPL